MRATPLFALTLGAAAWMTVGCSLPGQPGPEPEVVRPEAIHSATILYQQNCSGCHGAEGKLGAAANLADPVYQAWVDDATLRNITANGATGSLMPAFAKSIGGELTDSQIDALVQGMRKMWFKGNVLAGLDAPPYLPDGPGDPSRGQAVYTTYCASCHGPVGGKAGKSGSVLNGSFLALLPAQSLRTAVVVGRTDLGMPDWRNDVPGKAMSNTEINDVVAWMVSLTPTRPGQVHPQAYSPLPRPPHASPQTDPTMQKGIEGKKL